MTEHGSDDERGETARAIEEHIRLINIVMRSINLANDAIMANLETIRALSGTR